MYSEALKPGALLGPYPQRPAQRLNALDKAVLSAASRLRLSGQRPHEFAAQVEQLAPHLSECTAAELLDKLQPMRAALQKNGLNDAAAITEAFALVREFATRVLGKRHYPSQIIGGWIILNGKLAEMDTGEGKTLSATLPASIAALAGIPVHIITTSDYLATRDAESMGPLYATLGLSVGTVTADLGDLAERRAAYACDITYCTNKQVAFDYLRDQVNIEGSSGRLDRLIERVADSGRPAPVLRGLCFGIIDEADSVLIDEARTPLILSRSLPDSPEPEIFHAARELAAQLRPGEDYLLDLAKGLVELMTEGRQKLSEICRTSGSLLSSRRQREKLVIQALRAEHFFVRDEHYLVHDGKVQIIDAYTGRRMKDRAWERGLHQIIEAREEVPISPVADTLARTSYQQFFARYMHLGAMSGTAMEVAGELRSTYGLDVVRVASHCPKQRHDLGTHLYKHAECKWQACIDRVKELHAAGRPILIGTRSVASSENLSRLLADSDLPNTVLNARHDANEAEIIARAGEAGRITIATNMAGRGTDIMLDHGVTELGGLHVILAESNEARRIDRQLFGRCGRQGDPGSYEAFLSLEDEIVSPITDRYPWILLKRTSVVENFAFDCLRRWLVRRAQRKLERQHLRIRRRLASSDEQISNALSFTGVS